ncbi:uncharacterized protein LOC113206415 [Frankliniella occidentalis]|uniref:Uncharacterized protein LOC113206415 n=1 Tax=Frankliniella occidentalis TaxID=133901 RepID=A0A9C6X213_FRAOC|nr:uncharacterized protein LOC113206415 [Frankliniella occidentalis]
MTRCVVCFAALLLVQYRTLPSSTAAPASHFIHSVAGPFRIILDHYERCPISTGPPGPLFKDTFHRGYHDRRNPDLWHYWMNFTTLLTLDDSYDIDLNWASWSSRGGWKENAYVMRPGSFCKSIQQSDPQFWRKLMTAIFNDPNRNCPIPPGYYEMNNISADFSFKKIPVFFYGTWRMSLRLVKDTTKNSVACLWFFAKTIPKT